MNNSHIEHVMCPHCNYNVPLYYMYDIRTKSKIRGVVSTNNEHNDCIMSLLIKLIAGQESGHSVRLIQKLINEMHPRKILSEF